MAAERSLPGPAWLSEDADTAARPVPGVTQCPSFLDARVLVATGCPLRPVPIQIDDETAVWSFHWRMFMACGAPTAGVLVDRLTGIARAIRDCTFEGSQDDRETLLSPPAIRDAELLSPAELEAAGMS